MPNCSSYSHQIADYTTHNTSLHCPSSYIVSDECTNIAYVQIRIIALHYHIASLPSSFCVTNIIITATQDYQYNDTIILSLPLHLKDFWPPSSLHTVQCHHLQSSTALYFINHSYYTFTISPILVSQLPH